MDKILKEHFDKFAARNMLPPELRALKECQGSKLLADKKLLGEWRNNLKGIAWHDSHGNMLHGAVDNVLVKGKKLIVLDYKTRGFPVKENTHESYQNQLDIYNFLLRKNGYETDEHALLLFYMPKEVLETGEVIFDTKLVSVKVNINNAEMLFNKAIKILRGPCPKQSQECEWCKLINA